MLESDENEITGANHVAQYLELDWLVRTLLTQIDNKNFEFAICTLQLLSDIMFTNQKDMNLMLSKYKLLDILIKCWNDLTASSIIELIINACLNKYFNSRYSNFPLSLLKSSELMCNVLQ